ncbi:hypothetical protein JCM11491_002879 [Sporobolomyces phaffii]
MSAMSEADLKEQQERLTALVNVLGFTSLDHLEDYVILHGAARVVPASSVAAAGASLPLDDTQTQGCSYSATRHAQRNEERKREILRLHSQVEELRKELNWLRREHEKHVDAVDGLRKDKTRLMDLVEDAQRKASAAVARSPGGGDKIDDDFAALVEEASALYGHIDQLDEYIFELEEEKSELEARVDSAEKAQHDLVADYDSVQADLMQAIPELDGMRLEIETLKLRLGDATAEIDRLRTVESNFDKFKGLLEPLNAVAARSSPAPVPRRSPVPVPSTASRLSGSLVRSSLANAASHVTPSALSRSLRDSAAFATSRAAPNAFHTPMSTTPVAQAAAAVTGIPTTAHISPSSPATSTVAATTNRSPSASPRPTHRPEFAASAANDPIPRPSMSAAPVASTSASPTGSRLTSVQARRLKQYPMLLSAYLAAVNSFSSPQTWAAKVIPSLEGPLVSALPPPPPVPTCPSTEFPSFDPLPPTNGTSDKSRHPWIEEGTLDSRYELLEDCEKRAARRLADWKVWITSARTTAHGQGKETPGAQDKQKAMEMGTPTATKTLVKKKRRISKEGPDGTPAASVISPLTSSNVRAMTRAPTSSSSNASTTTSIPSFRARSPPIAADPAVVEGETQLPASPERPVAASFIDGAPSTSKKKNWNVLSPKKKKSTVARTAGLSAKSPRKSPLPNRTDPVVLVDDTQPRDEEAQSVVNLQSDPADAEPEAEPDTLRSTEEAEPDTIRSSEAAEAPSRLSRHRSRSVSRSPRKQNSSSQLSSRFSPAKKSPLRRTAAVTQDFLNLELGPKPPFSPSYAAKMAHQALVASSPVPPEVQVGSTSRVPFQPSPNRHSQPSRSPSSSPLKESLAMPPSAQPLRLYQDDRDEPADGTDAARGLLFTAELSLSPQKQRGSPGKGKANQVALVKEEEEAIEERDPFAAAVENSARTTRSKSKARKDVTPSPSPKKKKKKRKSDGRDEGRSSKRSRTSPESVGVELRDHDEDDVKPDIAQHSSEDIGSMPMGSAEEEGRRLWIQKIQTKRHEKIVKQQQEKAAKSPRVQLELNPDRNQGQKHAFKETERRKAVRQAMVAEACGNCKAYYDRKKQPVPIGHCNHTVPPTEAALKNPSKGGWLDTRAAEAEKRMQQDSRHRAAQRSVPEPPDYWQMGFPNTQQAEQINARAKQLKADQENYKRIEAE